MPDGFMRSSPQMGAAEAVASQPSFWSQFAMIVFFNMGVVTLIIVLCNFNRIKGVPVGYLVPVSLAITGGLVVGTNSFLSDDLDRYSSVREAMALGQTIGGLETRDLSSSSRPQCVGRLPLPQLVAVERTVEAGESDETPRHPALRRKRLSGHRDLPADHRRLPNRRGGGR
jgi:hypothetical protein